MKFKVGAVIVAGTLIGAVALMPSASEGRGGNGSGRGRCGQSQQQCRQQNPNCPQEGKRLRDGSCGNSACPQEQRANCPGPNGSNQSGATQGDAGAAPVAK